MVKDRGKPSRSASRRSRRTHAEWNVDTHIFSATGPTSAATRDFISSAALLVNVMARISNGLTPWSRIRWAMRWVSTRVLPDPAPATTSSGPSAWVTASDWTGLSPPSSPDAPSGAGAGASGAAGAARRGGGGGGNPAGGPPPWGGGDTKK